MNLNEHSTGAAYSCRIDASVDALNTKFLRNCMNINARKITPDGDKIMIVAFEPGQDDLHVIFPDSVSNGFAFWDESWFCESLSDILHAKIIKSVAEILLQTKTAKEVSEIRRSFDTFKRSYTEKIIELEKKIYHFEWIVQQSKEILKTEKGCKFPRNTFEKHLEYISQVDLIAQQFCANHNLDSLDIQDKQFIIGWIKNKLEERSDS